MKSEEELWEILRSYGITTEEELKKSLKKYGLNIAPFTEPLLEYKDK